MQFESQRGATLIEAMVSLLIFSVGALGIAAMQTTSLVRGDDTKQRSVAIWKGQELVDRMRSTKTIADPDGLLDEYLTEIGASTAAAIGSYTAKGAYSCPASAPTRCDDQQGSAAGTCSASDIVKFDVWSVICDPITGASVGPAGVADDSSFKLKNLDIALVANDVDFDSNGTVDSQEYFLYFEWLARSAEQNSNIQASSGAAKTIVTELCGTDVNVDTRLDAYCLRFH